MKFSMSSALADIQSAYRFRHPWPTSCLCARTSQASQHDFSY